MVKRISPWAWSSKLDKYTRFSSLFDHGQEDFFFLDHDWASIANAQGFHDQEEIKLLFTMIEQAWQMHKVFGVVCSWSRES